MYIRIGRWLSSTCVGLIMVGILMGLVGCGTTISPTLPLPRIGTPQPGEFGEVDTLAFSPDSHTIAAGYGGLINDPSVRLWSVNQPQTTPVLLSGHTSSLAQVAFSPDGQMLASLSTIGTVRIWQLNSLQTGSIVLTNPGKPILAFAFQPNADRLILSTTDALWSWDLRQPQARELRPFSDIKGANVLAISPDGSTLAATKSTTIQLWNLHESEQTLPELLSPQGAIDALAFSSDGRLLAAGGLDGTVWLWKITQTAEGPRSLRLTKYNQSPASTPMWINSISFSPDGQLIAVGCRDWAVRIWRMANLESPPMILPHFAAISTVAFSTDSKLFASGSDDRKVRLWTTNQLNAMPTVLPTP